MSKVQTPTLGAGLCPAGTSPGGFGSPATLTVSSMQDLVTSRNLPGNARYINPNTGDYEINSNGFLVGTDVVQQMVYLALVTVKGTSIQTDLGQNYTNSKVISPNLSTQVKAQTQQALSKLILNKKIELISTNISFPRNDPNFVQISVTWRKLETDEVIVTTV